MVTILRMLMCLVDNENKYTRFAGDFEDHADARVRFGAHRPMSTTRASGGATERLQRAIIRTVLPWHIRHGHQRRRHNKHNKT